MRADRLLSLLMLLQTNGRMTAATLAERLEVSTRTVYRDLDALSAAGVPVYAERGPGGGCSLLEPYRTNLTGLNKEEVRALFSLTVSDLMEDLHQNRAAESAWLKLTASLPERLQQDARIVRQRFHMDPAGWFQPDEPVPYVHLVQEAVWYSRRLRMQYRMADGTWIKQLVDPYGLVAKASVWYLVAAIFGRIRVYRVSRIQEATLTDNTFSYPDDFDLINYWQHWCEQFETSLGGYKVSIRLNPGGVQALVTAFGEGIYHLAHQAQVGEGDGSQLQLSFASRKDACQQLLGLGTVIEVVTPQALRKEMRKTATRLAAHYS